MKGAGKQICELTQYSSLTRYVCVTFGRVFIRELKQMRKGIPGVFQDGSKRHHQREPNNGVSGKVTLQSLHMGILVRTRPPNLPKS